jgi:hypothetical protein
MRLDEHTSPTSSEALSIRLWRRYGSEAFALLEAIRADPRQAELLIEGAEYLRCEIAQAARREMIVDSTTFSIAQIRWSSRSGPARRARPARSVHHLVRDETDRKLAACLETGKSRSACVVGALQRGDVDL